MLRSFRSISPRTPDSTSDSDEKISAQHELKHDESDTLANQVKQVEGLMLRAQTKIELAKNKRLVMVIGSSGAGKSTFVGYQLGCRFIREVNEVGDTLAIPDSSQGELKSFPKVGHKTKSKTSFPGIYVDQEFAYSDNPGFDENRGVITRTFASVSTQMALNLSESIRAIVVLIDINDILRKAEPFRNLTKILGHLIRDPGSISKSILFLFTHATKDQLNSRPGIIKRIKEIITEQEKNYHSMFKSFNAEMEQGIFKSLLAKSGKTKNALISEKHINDAHAQLEFLKLMHANQDNIIMLDVFDEGQSRNLILERLRKSAVIPKESFCFTNYDETRIRFDRLLLNMIGESLTAVKNTNFLLENISAWGEELKGINEKIPVYQELKASLRSRQSEQVPFLQQVDEKKDPSLPKKILLKQQNNTNNELDAINKKIESLKVEITKYEIDLNELDSTKPVSLHHEKTDPPGFFTVRINKTFYYQSEVPFLDPIVRYDEKAGKLEVIKNDKNGDIAKGIKPEYKSQYTSNMLSRAPAELFINVESRQHPNHKLAISDLKNTLEQRKFKLDALQSAKEKIVEESKHLSQWIEKIDQTGETEAVQEIEEKITQIDKYITEKQVKQTELQTQIMTSQETLGELIKDFETKKDLYETIVKMASWLNYRNPPVIEFDEQLKRYKTLKLEGAKAVLAKKDEKIPAKFICTYTRKMFEDPYIVTCGCNFDFTVIYKYFDEWASKHKKQEACPCPKCGTKINPKIKILNKTFKDEIETFRKSRMMLTKMSAVDGAALLNLFSYRNVDSQHVRQRQTKAFRNTLPVDLASKAAKFESKVEEAEAHLDQLVTDYTELDDKCQAIHSIKQAIAKGNLQTLKESEGFIKANLSSAVDEEDNSFLMYAGRIGAKLEVFQYFIENNMGDLISRNAHGETVLFKIINSDSPDQIEIAQYFASKNIKLDIISQAGSVFLQIVERITKLRKSKEEDKAKKLHGVLIILVNNYVIRQQSINKLFNINDPLPVKTGISLPLFPLVAMYGDSELMKDVILHYSPDVRKKISSDTFSQPATPLSKMLTSMRPSEDKDTHNEDKLNVLLDQLQLDSDQKIIEEAKSLALPAPLAACLENTLGSLKKLSIARERLAKLITFSLFWYKDEKQGDLPAVEQYDIPKLIIKESLESLPKTTLNEIYSKKLQLESILSESEGISRPQIKRFAIYIKKQFVYYFYGSYSDKQKERTAMRITKLENVAQKKLKSLGDAYKSKGSPDTHKKIIQFKDFIYETVNAYVSSTNEYQLFIDNLKIEILLDLIKKYHDRQFDWLRSFLDKINILLQNKLNFLPDLLLDLSLEKVEYHEKNLKNIFTEALFESIDYYASNKKSMDEKEVLNIISLKMDAILSNYQNEYFANSVTDHVLKLYNLARDIAKKTITSTGERREKFRVMKEHKPKHSQNSIDKEHEYLAIHLIKSCLQFYFYTTRDELDTPRSTKITSLLLEVLTNFDSRDLLNSTARQKEFQDTIIKSLMELHNEKESKQAEKKDSQPTLSLESKLAFEIPEDDNFKIKAKAFRIIFIASITHCLDICDGLIRSEVRQNETWAERCQGVVSKISDQKSGWISSVLQNVAGKSALASEIQQYLPTVMGAIKLALGAIDSYIQYKNIQQARNVWESFSGDKIQKSDDLEEIANELIKRYRYHIQQASIITTTRDGRIEPYFDPVGGTSSNGVIQLAVCAASRVISHLKYGKSKYYSENKNFIFAAIKKAGSSIYNAWHDRYDEKELIPLRKRVLLALEAEKQIGRDIELSTAGRKQSAWKLAGVFDKSGFIVIEDDQIFYYKSSNSELKKYGFCYVDVTEVSRRGLEQIPDSTVEAELSEFYIKRKRVAVSVAITTIPQTLFSPSSSSSSLSPLSPRSLTVKQDESEHKLPIALKTELKDEEKSTSASAPGIGLG